ncbi:MAG: PD-(D/E)XK nuclease superfamily protein [Bacillota bacterium]
MSKPKSAASQSKAAKEFIEKVRTILDGPGLKCQEQTRSELGSAMIGRGQDADLTVVDDEGDPIMLIECKVQNTSGTAEEKLFRVIEGANRDKERGIPSIIVFSGYGWSTDLLRHAMLYCAVREEHLEEGLSIYFRYSPNRSTSRA